MDTKLIRLILWVGPLPYSLIRQLVYSEGYGSAVQAITRVYSRDGLEYEMYSPVND